MSGTIFTTSWDDGHPMDVKVAELLDRRGFNGTFYVPVRNAEGKPVLSTGDLAVIDRRFEIGSHTLDHLYLKGVPATLAERQVIEGKNKLENLLGHGVTGFAYPGGRYDPALQRIVSTAGFSYARTIENFRLDCGTDRFLMPTTLQMFPHQRSTYLRNLVSRGNFLRRRQLFSRAMRTPQIFALLRETLDLACQTQGIFHLWGHSYEIDSYNLWQPLDNFLSYAADRIPPHNRLNNASVLTEKIGLI